MSKPSGMDETEYLLSSDNNAEHLKKSIEQTSIETTSYVDSDMVVRLMDNMSLAELKMLKATCSILINFKLNEALNNQQ